MDPETECIDAIAKIHPTDLDNRGVHDHADRDDHRWHEMDRSIMIGIEILAFGAAVWFLNLMQNDLIVPGL